MATQALEFPPSIEHPEQIQGPRTRPFFIGESALKLATRPLELAPPKHFKVANIAPRSNFVIPSEARHPLEPAITVKQHGINANLITAINIGNPQTEEYKSFLFLRFTKAAQKQGELDRLLKVTELAGKPRRSSRAVLLEDLPDKGRPKGLIINVGDIVHFGTGERCNWYFDMPDDLEPYHCTLEYNDVEVLTVMNHARQPDSVFVAVGRSIGPEEDLPPRVRID